MSNGFIGPRRPDPKGIYESSWGDIRDVASPFAGAAAGAAGFPLSLILLLASGLLGSMFEKKEDPLEEAMNLRRQMGILGYQQPYQSRFTSTVDPVVARALLAQLKRTSNWGWPSRMGMDTSFIEDALRSIGAGGVPGVIRKKQTGGVIGG